MPAVVLSEVPHTDKEAPWRRSSFVIICCVCTQPASPYIHHAHIPRNSCTRHTPHLLSVTCTQDNLFF